MKTSLDHLPEHKQEELTVLRNTILDYCPDIEMIILYGSYARGDWQEDIYKEDHITYEYKSDYDILLVFKTEKQANKQGLQLKFEKLIQETRLVATHVSIIMHAIKFVNKKTSHGNYFFVDIYKEGIFLYNSQNFELEAPRELSNEERKKHAQEDFDYWFHGANEFFIDYNNAFLRNSYNKAAFELHQAVERYYHAILLVFTGYKAKIHDIEELDKKAKNQHSALCKVFPRSNSEEEYMFQLLKKAYIDARYKKDYNIRKEELEYLCQRVEHLKTITHSICKEKIESFTA